MLRRDGNEGDTVRRSAPLVVFSRKEETALGIGCLNVLSLGRGRSSIGPEKAKEETKGVEDQPSLRVALKKEERKKRGTHSTSAVSTSASSSTTAAGVALVLREATRRRKNASKSVPDFLSFSPSSHNEKKTEGLTHHQSPSQPQRQRPRTPPRRPRSCNQKKKKTPGSAPRSLSLAFAVFGTATRSTSVVSSSSTTAAGVVSISVGLTKKRKHVTSHRKSTVRFVFPPFSLARSAQHSLSLLILDFLSGVSDLDCSSLNRLRNNGHGDSRGRLVDFGGNGGKKVLRRVDKVALSRSETRVVRGSGDGRRDEEEREQESSKGGAHF